MKNHKSMEHIIVFHNIRIKYKWTNIINCNQTLNIILEQ